MELLSGKVELIGLSSAAHLNGQIADARRFDPDRGRYEVLCADGLTRLIKPGNLKPRPARAMVAKGKPKMVALCSTCLLEGGHIRALKATLQSLREQSSPLELLFWGFSAAAEVATEAGEEAAKWLVDGIVDWAADTLPPEPAAKQWQMLLQSPRLEDVLQDDAAVWVLLSDSGDFCHPDRVLSFRSAIEAEADSADRDIRSITRAQQTGADGTASALSLDEAERLLGSGTATVVDIEDDAADCHDFAFRLDLLREFFGWAAEHGNLASNSRWCIRALLRFVRLQHDGALGLYFEPTCWMYFRNLPLDASPDICILRRPDSADDEMADQAVTARLLTLAPKAPWTAAEHVLAARLHIEAVLVDCHVGRSISGNDIAALCESTAADLSASYGCKVHPGLPAAIVRARCRAWAIPEL